VMNQHHNFGQRNISGSSEQSAPAADSGETGATDVR
jgi:hypothetical protein